MDLQELGGLANLHQSSLEVSDWVFLVSDQSSIFSFLAKIGNTCAACTSSPRLARRGVPTAEASCSNGAHQLDTRLEVARNR